MGPGNLASGGAAPGNPMRQPAGFLSAPDLGLPRWLCPSKAPHQLPGATGVSLI